MLGLVVGSYPRRMGKSVSGCLSLLSNCSDPSEWAKIGLTRMRLFVYSGNRADFGLLSPIIHGLSKGHEISLLVGGSHQEKAMGETAREVVWSVGDKSRIFCLSSSGSAETELFSDSFCGVSHYLRSDPPDFLILLGDRIETLGAAVAAHLAGVKIAHVHGGDRTDGSRDNASRHAISKLAHVHFPA